MNPGGGGGVQEFHLLEFRVSGSIISSLAQCCGSGLFIPDPTFFYPGSELSPSRIPDPHQRI
jgi:hypothetical protein